MIFETTYNRRDIILSIEKLVGQPFSLIKRLKMGGIGSKRMHIETISQEYVEYMNPGHYVTYGNLELRPKGIIIHFRFKLESYAWPIPYDNLKIKTEPDLTFHIDDKFISFKQGMETNGPFIEKLRHFLNQ